MSVRRAMSRLGGIIILGLSWGFNSLAADSQAGPNYDPWSQAATYEIQYIVDLSGLPKHESVNLWVPKPANNIDQSVLSSKVLNLPDSWRAQQVTDNRGNPVLEYHLPIDPQRIVSLSFVYKIKRHVSKGLPVALMSEQDRPDLYLRGTSKIPLGGLILSIAEQQKSNLPDDSDLRAGFYNYVFDSMTYSKEGEGWGQGDAIWACQSKYGNCTDFHSLYIGLVRSQQIPARFKIGFPISAEQRSGRHDGYHCWAETFDDTSGWKPVDISEAKKANNRVGYFGKLPSDRIEFSTGRDLVLSNRQRGKPINYFIYPYAETSNEIVDRLPVELHYRRISVGIDDEESLSD